MRRWPSVSAASIAVAGATAFAVTACGKPSATSASQDSALVSGARIGVAPPTGVSDGEWSLPGRDYANSRFSNLSQITPANAANLHVAWTFSTGVLRGHEGQPLVVGNTMYVVTP